jgi:hypothetical protein
MRVLEFTRHNYLTVRTYVTLCISPKMAWHVLSIYNSLNYKYIKLHTIIHKSSIIPLIILLGLLNFLLYFIQGLTLMKTNPINQQYHPLALMETLWCNIEVISLILPLWPSLPLEPCIYALSPSIYLCIW